ncbi:transforming growth factor-beta-induced protein ig-h3 [Trichonephila clavata]|uniref:Transforming growth factor-beta-induced protein ig-h3 n=1 Tax=Trichonephila clavata TaxID=2740835 RepID=A0A8X6LJ27_TRICU|nr:transforming growth factor-beta-induced protein ig-h3 [Trichonephila clavata]
MLLDKLQTRTSKANIVWLNWPNTCAVEEVPGTNQKYWTECKYWMNREICGVKTVLRYECCEGFHQIGKNGGCFGVKPMTDVVKTARDLGATTFVDYLNEAGLTERLTTPGEAITLFAPTNEAFQVNTVFFFHLMLRKDSTNLGKISLHFVKL